MTAGEFHPYGVSHWAVLVLTGLGGLGLVGLGRCAPERVVHGVCRALALGLVLPTMCVQVYVFRPADPLHTLPLQLSDWAPYLAAIALWARYRWACALTAYWCLTLSPQALITPVLRGPDFPGVEFVVFFWLHVLVTWAAIMLVWGLRRPPGWREYRFAVVATAVWATATYLVNLLGGTNFGFLNAKPETPSVLDLFGPWPWYLIPEAVSLFAVWALLTWAWRPRPPGAHSDERSFG